MDVVLSVHGFDAGEGLVCDHERGLEAEDVSAEDEEVVHGRPEQLFDEQVAVGVHEVGPGPEVLREAFCVRPAHLPRRGSAGWRLRAAAGPRCACLRSSLRPACWKPGLRPD